VDSVHPTQERLLFGHLSKSQPPTSRSTFSGSTFTSLLPLADLTLILIRSRHTRKISQGSPAPSVRSGKIVQESGARLRDQRASHQLSRSDVKKIVLNLPRSAACNWYLCVGKSFHRDDLSKGQTHYPTDARGFLCNGHPRGLHSGICGNPEQAAAGIELGLMKSQQTQQINKKRRARGVSFQAVCAGQPNLALFEV
jgi:hypothetical protein